jgi:hypothetical protein
MHYAIVIGFQIDALLNSCVYMAPIWLRSQYLIHVCHIEFVLHY